MTTLVIAAILVTSFFVLYKPQTQTPSIPDQSASSAIGDTREQGLSFVYDRLIELGWNVEKAPQKTSEYDFELYKKEIDKRIRVKVKTVRGNNNFPFGNNIDRMKGDFWILVKIPASAEHEPTAFIMRPAQVENLIHIYGGNKSDSKPSYWLRPEAYEKDEFRNRWELLGMLKR